MLRLVSDHGKFSTGVLGGFIKLFTGAQQSFGVKPAVYTGPPEIRSERRVDYCRLIHRAHAD